MSTPTFSTFAAISELFVTAGVFYVIFTNVKGRGFKWKLATTVILFEFFINMLYMIFRMQQHTVSESSSGLVALAAGHGFLSLFVFILFVVFSFLAYSAIKKGNHFFQENRALTYGFIGLWTISVLSGEVLYFISFS
ncbi:MAG: hypothetical protein ACE5HI_15955 [bacterium]